MEVADRPSKYSLSLGGAVLVSRTAYASNWRLQPSRASTIIEESRKSKEANLINCDMDELIGIAFATRLPVCVSESLYSSVCLDGLLEKQEKVGDPIVITPLVLAPD